MLQEFFVQEECDTKEELDGSCNHFHIVNDTVCEIAIRVNIHFVGGLAPNTRLRVLKR